MTGQDTPVAVSHCNIGTVQHERQRSDEQRMAHLHADDESYGKDREAPATAQMAFIVDEEVVGFHACAHSSTCHDAEVLGAISDFVQPVVSPLTWETVIL